MAETLYAMIGKEVSRRRRSTMTQADLGDALVKAGIPAQRPRQLAYMIESGRRHLTAVDLVLLAKVLNTSVPDLMEPPRADTPEGEPVPGDVELPGTTKASGKGKGKPVTLKTTEVDDLVYERFYRRAYTIAQVQIMDSLGMGPRPQREA